MSCDLPLPPPLPSAPLLFPGLSPKYHIVAGLLVQLTHHASHPLYPRAALGSISIHEYPTTNCDGRTSSIPALLADAAAEGVAAVMAPFVGLCEHAGIPFRIGEGNSASCGGVCVQRYHSIRLHAAGFGLV